MNLPTRAKVFIVFLSAFCLLALIYSGINLTPPTKAQIAILAVFLILAILSEAYATWIPFYRSEISSSVAIYLAGLFILGPFLGVYLVFVSSLASELLLRWKEKETGMWNAVVPLSFNVSQLVLSLAMAGLVLTYSGQDSLLLQSSQDYIWAVLAFLAYSITNLALVRGIVSLAGGGGFFYGLWKSLREFSLQYIVLCASALLLTVLYSISVWHVFLGLVPLILVHVSFRSYLQLQTEARKTFEKISRILDERDHYTAVHSTSVAELAVKIAQEMELSESEIEKIDIAAKVHDIGKIAVRDAILLKPGKLDAEEWKIMKKHPVISAELIEGLSIYSHVANAVRHEHEHWDGSGYPDGLKGNEIPLIARIITAADVYDALSTDRPYRKAFSREKSLEILQKMRGKELDPEVADALERVLKSEEG
ncbi:HD domain-containing protein [Candidatus Bipolaricaulota bacterium]|nr:HD domain-containing protein [Candidatus Bipolaricaulota bacterium]